MVSCGGALAGRPLVTEDAGVLAKGQCEWESFAGVQDRPSVRLAASQVGCGVGLDSQLALGVSRERSAGDRASFTMLSGKTAVGAADGAAQVALAYTLLGGHEQTDYMRYAGAEIKAVVTVPLRGWLWHANVGVVHVRQEHERRVTWAVAAERPRAIGAIDLMGEIYGDHRNSPWVQVAARWTAVPDRLFFDASCGIQTNAGHTRLATLGMKLAF